MTSKIGLEEHMDTFHDKRTFTCDICSKIISFKSNTPQSLMGYIARKANEVKRCPKVKQNMRINMVLTIFDNIVRFKRNLKK